MSVYIPPKSVTVLFTCGTLTHVLKLQWLIKTYTPQSNSWLRHWIQRLNVTYRPPWRLLRWWWEVWQAQRSRLQLRRTWSEPGLAIELTVLSESTPTTHQPPKTQWTLFSSKIIWRNSRDVMWFWIFIYFFSVTQKPPKQTHYPSARGRMRRHFPAVRGAALLPFMPYLVWHSFIYCIKYRWQNAAVNKSWRKIKNNSMKYKIIRIQQLSK